VHSTGTSVEMTMNTDTERKQYLERIVKSMESLKEIAVDLKMFDEHMLGSDESLKQKAEVDQN
jgi:hypothetical protein